MPSDILKLYFWVLMGIRTPMLILVIGRDMTILFSGGRCSMAVYHEASTMRRKPTLPVGLLQGTFDDMARMGGPSPLCHCRPPEPRCVQVPRQHVPRLQELVVPADWSTPPQLFQGIEGPADSGKTHKTTQQRPGTSLEGRNGSSRMGSCLDAKHKLL